APGGPACRRCRRLPGAARCACSGSGRLLAHGAVPGLARRPAGARLGPRGDADRPAAPRPAAPGAARARARSAAGIRAHAAVSGAPQKDLGARRSATARLASALGPALAERDFRLLWFALLGMGMGEQMLEVAICW